MTTYLYSRQIHICKMADKIIFETMQEVDEDTDNHLSVYNLYVIHYAF